MEWKMFGIKGKLGSVKQKVFRLISGLGKEDSGVSLPTSVFTDAPCKPVNSITNYSLVTNMELKKAQALMYWGMMNRPK